MEVLEGKSPILFCTDVEGNWDYFTHWVALVPQFLSLKQNGGDVELDFVDSTARFVYGGDVCDKGNGNIRTVRALLRFKQRYPDRVVIICGNRDYNKMRFTSELNPEYLALVHDTPGPYWVKEAARVSPKQFLTKLVAANKAKEESAVTDAEVDEVNTLTNRILWMLKDTMGAAGDFDRRREELVLLSGKANVTDEEVAHSYVCWVGSSVGEGLVGEAGELRELLKVGQLAFLDDDTRTLFVHGGLQRDALGYVPEIGQVADLRDWASKLNFWAGGQYLDWVQNPRFQKGRENETFVEGGRNGDWSARGGNRLMAYVCPGSEPTVVLNSMFDNNTNMHDVSAPIADALLLAGIRRLATGHQPHGNSASITCTKNLQLIDADTSYSHMGTPDNRGSAVTAVAFNRDVTAVEGVLEDNREIAAVIGGPQGDPLIGKNVKVGDDDQWWVKCRFKHTTPEGNQYLLQKVTGFKVEYHDMSESEAHSQLSGVPHMIHIGQQSVPVTADSHTVPIFEAISSQVLCRWVEESQNYFDSIEGIHIDGVGFRGLTVESLSGTASARQGGRAVQVPLSLKQSSVAALVVVWARESFDKFVLCVRHHTGALRVLNAEQNETGQLEGAEVHSLAALGVNVNAAALHVNLTHAVLNKRSLHLPNNASVDCHVLQFSVDTPTLEKLRNQQEMVLVPIDDFEGRITDTHSALTASLYRRYLGLLEKPSLNALSSLVDASEQRTQVQKLIARYYRPGLTVDPATLATLIEKYVK